MILSFNSIKISFLVFLAFFCVGIYLVFASTTDDKKDPWKSVKTHRPHLDHAHFFPNKIDSPQEVTKTCLSCHKQAATEFMKTSHWRWERNVTIKNKEDGGSKEISIGKKNLINNFCIGVQGNWVSCTICHAGYGWDSDEFDFEKKENIDCLICHDWSGTYAKGKSGMPAEGVDLQVAAQSVGYPKRDNCGRCHVYGGGGMGVKHGDLDDTLLYPSGHLDVHMGKHNFLCIDCHKTKEHQISGTSFSVSIDHQNGFGCTSCHDEKPHVSSQINNHSESIACETCHIPRYARRAPTKTHWDYAKAGDLSREDKEHEYLRIKGEFIYGQNLIPEYLWFSYKVDRYLLKDKIDPSVPTPLNPPIGSISDRKSKIAPFKIHYTNQPYDKKYEYLLQPITAGEGGFWHEFDWEKSFRLMEERIGIPYSGEYGFAKTTMHWPLEHMIGPAHQALKCNECHNNPEQRMDWQSLGYPGDPMNYGNRKALGKLMGSGDE